jgi:hypothetical protein
MWKGGGTGCQVTDWCVTSDGGGGGGILPAQHQVRGGGEELVEEGQAPPTLRQLSMQLQGGQVETYGE